LYFVDFSALGPTQPPIQWVPGALFLGVKRPGRETDHSLPSGAEVKNEWSYTSTPQYVFKRRRVKMFNPDTPAHVICVLYNFPDIHFIIHFTYSMSDAAQPLTRRIRGVGHVARIGEMRNAYSIFGWKT
jgi:hypothetical protein